MDDLRVSVATYDQVVFPRPETGTLMLALERKATVWKDGSVRVLAQPFGGGVRILKPKPLTEMLGKIEFDSERSEQEQDLRILIPPAKWDEVKQYCLRHLEDPGDTELESTPDRELFEEVEEAMQMSLKPGQYTVQPTGFVIEDGPVRTENWNALGRLTVRIYRTFQVEITDRALCKAMISVSERVADWELGRQALDNGKGRANSVLALPLNSIRETYLALPAERRYRKIRVEEHDLDESVLAVLMDVDVPQYLRM